MTINHKTLFLEKRGCDFSKYDTEMLENSDCENYRLCGRIVDKHGRNLFIELTRCDARRFHNIRTGKPLKNFVIEHSHKLYISTQYDNFDGSWRDLKLESKIYDLNLNYTQKDILKAVNILAGNKEAYNNIVIMDTMPDLWVHDARITSDDKKYLFENIIQATPEEVDAVAGQRERNALKYLAGYKKTNGGETVELFYQNIWGDVYSVEWHINRRVFTG